VTGDVQVSVVLALGLAVVSVLLRPTWRIVRYPVTAVHELGHVVVAVLLGGRVPRVRLWRDTSGVTTWRTTQGGRLRSALIALAGHAMPPAVGAACALALAADEARWALIGLTVLVAVVTLAIRNLWGLAVCAALAGACWLAWSRGPEAGAVLVAAAAGILCLGGIRATAEELVTNRSGRGSDTQVVARALHVPAGAAGAALLLWALACTVLATWKLAVAA
jgi:hypothetical protein